MDPSGSAVGEVLSGAYRAIQRDVPFGLNQGSSLKSKKEVKTMQRRGRRGKKH